MSSDDQQPPVPDPLEAEAEPRAHEARSRSNPPAGDPPVSGAPVGQVRVDQARVDQARVDQIPVDQVPISHPPISDPSASSRPSRRLAPPPKPKHRDSTQMRAVDPHSGASHAVLAEPAVSEASERRESALSESELRNPALQTFKAPNPPNLADLDLPGPQHAPEDIPINPPTEAGPAVLHEPSVRERRSSHPPRMVAPSPGSVPRELGTDPGSALDDSESIPATLSTPGARLPHSSPLESPPLSGPPRPRSNSHSGVSGSRPPPPISAPPRPRLNSQQTSRMGSRPPPPPTLVQASNAGAAAATARVEVASSEGVELAPAVSAVASTESVEASPAGLSSPASSLLDDGSKPDTRPLGRAPSEPPPRAKLDTLPGFSEPPPARVSDLPPAVSRSSDSSEEEEGARDSGWSVELETPEPPPGLLAEGDPMSVRGGAASAIQAMRIIAVGESAAPSPPTFDIDVSFGDSDSPEELSEDDLAPDSAEKDETLAASAPASLPPEDLTEAAVPAAPKPPPPPKRKPAPPPAPSGRRGEPELKVRERQRRAWWEEVFADDFVRAIQRLTDRQVSREVDFIEESLGVAAGGVVLDLACGAGYHAVELASRGYGVVGYDLSLFQLAKAADVAQDRGQKINFLQGDMREMAFEEMFDGVYCWNTSFGYFEEEKNLIVAQRIFRALRPGGMFLVDVANRDFIAQHQPSQVWFEGDSCVCMDDMSLDFITSRVRVKRSIILDDGRTRECAFSLRAYALHELGKMLHDVGFRVTEASGHPSMPGVFFGPNSPRLIMLAQKP